MRGKGPALFELLRNGQGKAAHPAGDAAPPPPPTPVVAAPPPVTPKPRKVVPAEPAPEPETATAQDAAPARRWFNLSAEGGGAALDKQVTVSASALMLIGGGVLALVVLVWAVAYSTGWSRGESTAVKDLGKGPPPVVVKDPLDQQVPLNPNLLGNNQTPKSPSGDLSASVAKAADPRQAGLNYLLLARLREDDARKAVDFLSSNGLPAFTVPVDPAGSAAKNRGLFLVYAAQGVTRDDLKARTTAVTGTDEAARVLGARWKKEFRSSTEFADRYWDKYLP